MAYIEIENLFYSYPEEDNKALKAINLTMEKGEINLILGSSGSGKSTLARCISGTIPDFYGGIIGGIIKIRGRSIKHMNHLDRAKEITMVFQDPEKQLLMNKVEREIAFGLENTSVDEKVIKRRVFEALQFTNIINLADREIKTLSGGEKQKVAIAAALSYMPDTIILDEPLSQLDPAYAEEIVGIITKINAELGITIIVIEQRIDKWFSHADKIIIMDSGKVDFQGKKEELYKIVNEHSLEFLPTYLKYLKKIGIRDCPQDFKNARKLLEKDFKNGITQCRKTRNEPYTEKKTSSESIRIKGLKFRYEVKEILKDIDLNIKSGDFVGILGANGAGKSTLLKCITGLLKYDGSIKLGDGSLEVKKSSINQIAKLVSYVSQNPNDYISKDSVYEELKFTMDNYGINDEARINEVLQSLEIENIKLKNPRDLSGGEKQRVAIASMLVLKSSILLLDEPTRGLDLKMKEKLGDLLLKLNSAGTTIMLITHDIEFAAMFCRRFVLMFDGSVIFDGLKNELLKNGIYYTTTISKLFRNIDNNVFTIKDAVEKYHISEEEVSIK